MRLLFPLLCLLHLALPTSFSDFVFLNSGTVKSTDQFELVPQCAGGVELQNVSNAQFAWTQFGLSAYLYQKNQSSNGTRSCLPSKLYPNAVFVSEVLDSAVLESFAECQAFCCKSVSCASWSFQVTTQAVENCPGDTPCCFLHPLVEAREATEGAVCGIVDHQLFFVPPNGMRSAVPLGGIGAGNFELRADGTFHEWTITNQSPAGSAKTQLVDEAVFGIWTEQSGGLMLRTHPPTLDGAQYRGVSELTYGGSFPMSRLQVKDPRLPVSATLFAFSDFHIGDAFASSTPAVAFSLEVANTSPAPQQVSFMLNMPFGLERETTRASGGSSKRAHFVGDYRKCAGICRLDSDCVAWTQSGHICSLIDEVTPSVWEENTSSGIMGQWMAAQSPSIITLNRDGTSPASGNISLYTSSKATFMVGDALADIWKQFSTTGGFPSSDIQSTNAFHGAISLNATLQPNETKNLTIVFSWFFPYRDHVGEDVGNFYQNSFSDSQDVALHFAEEMDEALSDIQTFHSLFFGTSLPEFLQDVLVNSLSHIRSGMWVADGRWRQWEAYDCNDIDSVHNDFQRELPYFLFFPEFEVQKMLAWADGQTDGMIQESLGFNTCNGPTYMPLDQPSGRVMADVTSTFALEAYQHYLWTGDMEFHDRIYPYVAQACEWQLNVSREYGMPTYMIDTYDILELDQFELASYNGFVHLASMLACKQMAILHGNVVNAKQFEWSFQLGQNTLLNQLWNGSYFIAYSGGNALMSDVMYGQVWAYTLGLGDLVPREYIVSHLQAEERQNDTPYGLRVMTGGPSEGQKRVRDSPCSNLDQPAKYDSVWMLASPDWTALSLHVGTNVSRSFSQAEKALNNWRLALRDQWNIHAIVGAPDVGADGQPWISSHYGFHMVMWHIPLALSGQLYSAPAKKLTFAPKLDSDYSLPVLIPKVFGILSSSNRTLTLRILQGELYLEYLSVGQRKYSKAPVSIKAGQEVTWE